LSGKEGFFIFANLYYLKIHKCVIFYHLKAVITFISNKQGLDWRIKESLIEIQPVGTSLPLFLEMKDFPAPSISSSFQCRFSIIYF
jgi:hypothetical protein